MASSILKLDVEVNEKGLKELIASTRTLSTAVQDVTKSGMKMNVNLSDQTHVQKMIEANTRAIRKARAELTAMDKLPTQLERTRRRREGLTETISAGRRQIRAKLASDKDYQAGIKNLKQQVKLLATMTAGTVQHEKQTKSIQKIRKQNLALQKKAVGVLEKRILKQKELRDELRKAERRIGSQIVATPRRKEQLSNVIAERQVLNKQLRDIARDIHLQEEKAGMSLSKQADEDMKQRSKEMEEMRKKEDINRKRRQKEIEDFRKLMERTQKQQAKEIEARQKKSEMVKKQADKEEEARRKKQESINMRLAKAAEARLHREAMLRRKQAKEEEARLRKEHAQRMRFEKRYDDYRSKIAEQIRILRRRSVHALGAQNAELKKQISRYSRLGTLVKTQQMSLQKISTLDDKIIDKLERQLSLTQKRLRYIQSQNKAISSGNSQLAISTKHLQNVRNSMRLANLQLAFHTISSLMRDVHFWFRELIYPFKRIVGLGIEFNQTIETTLVGIRAVVSSTTSIVDAQGDLLYGVEKYNATQKIAINLQRQLQVENLRTAATYEHLLLTFQGLAGPARFAGMDINDLVRFSRLIVTAVQSIGLKLNQAVQEGRDLLQGSINPMRSQLANALGIQNKQLKVWKEQGIQVEMLFASLQSYELAGQDIFKSFEGIKTNLVDIIKIVAGDAFRGTFETMKELGLKLQESFITIKDDGYKIQSTWKTLGKILDSSVVNVMRELEASVMRLGSEEGLGKIEQRFNTIIGLVERLAISGIGFAEGAIQQPAQTAGASMGGLYGALVGFGAGGTAGTVLSESVVKRYAGKFMISTLASLAGGFVGLIARVSLTIIGLLIGKEIGSLFGQVLDRAWEFIMGKRAQPLSTSEVDAIVGKGNLYEIEQAIEKEMQVKEKILKQLEQNDEKFHKTVIALLRNTFLPDLSGHKIGDTYPPIPDSLFNKPTALPPGGLNVDAIRRRQLAQSEANEDRLREEQAAIERREQNQEELAFIQRRAKDLRDIMTRLEEINKLSSSWNSTISKGLPQWRQRRYELEATAEQIAEIREKLPESLEEIREHMADVSRRLNDVRPAGLSMDEVERRLDQLRVMISLVEELKHPESPLPQVGRDALTIAKLRNILTEENKQQVEHLLSLSEEELETEIAVLRKRKEGYQLAVSLTSTYNDLSTSLQNILKYSQHLNEIEGVNREQLANVITDANLQTIEQLTNRLGEIASASQIARGSVSALDQEYADIIQRIKELNSWMRKLPETMTELRNIRGVLEQNMGVDVGDKDTLTDRLKQLKSMMVLLKEADTQGGKLLQAGLDLNVATGVISDTNLARVKEIASLRGEEKQQALEILASEIASANQKLHAIVLLEKTIDLIAKLLEDQIKGSKTLTDLDEKSNKNRRKELTRTLRMSKSITDNLSGSWRTFIDALTSDQERITKRFDEMFQGIHSQIQAITKGIVDLGLGITSSSQAITQSFKNLGQVIVDTLSNIVADQITISIVGQGEDSLMGKFAKRVSKEQSQIWGSAKEGLSDLYNKRIVPALGEMGGTLGKIGGFLKKVPVASIVSGSIGLFKNIQAGNKLGSAISGASTGAAVGSIFGPVGTLVGSAAGGIIGFIGSLFGGPKEKQIAFHIEARVKGQLTRASDMIDESLSDAVYAWDPKRASGWGEGGKHALAAEKYFRNMWTETLDGIDMMMSDLPVDVFERIGSVKNTVLTRTGRLPGGESAREAEKTMLSFDRDNKDWDKVKADWERFVQGYVGSIVGSLENYWVDALSEMGFGVQKDMGMGIGTRIGHALGAPRVDEVIRKRKNASKVMRQLRGGGIDNLVTHDWVQTQLDAIDALQGEARAEKAREFVETVNLIREAFNIIEGNTGVKGAIDQIINLTAVIGNIETLDSGFPTLKGIHDRIRELIALGDTTNLRKLIDLRKALLDVQSQLISMTSGLIGGLASINERIVELGGTPIDIDGYALQLLASIEGALSNPDLNLERQIELLNAFKSTLDFMYQADKKIRDERKKALDDYKSLLEDIADVFKSLHRTIIKVQTDFEGVFTKTEQVGFIKAQIKFLESNIQDLTPQDQMETAQELESLYQRLYERTLEAFGAQTPELYATYDEVIKGLSALRDYFNVEDELLRVTKLIEGNTREIKTLDFSTANITAGGITEAQLTKLLEGLDLNKSEVTKVIAAVQAVKAQEALTTAQVIEAVKASGLTTTQVQGVEAALKRLEETGIIATGGGITPTQLTQLLTAEGLSTAEITKVLQALQQVKAQEALTTAQVVEAVKAAGLTKDKVALVEAAVKGLEIELDAGDVTVNGITTEQLTKLLNAANLTTAEVVKVVTAIGNVFAQQVLTTAEVKKSVAAAGLTKTQVTAVKTAIDSLEILGGGITEAQLTKILTAEGLTLAQIKHVVSNTSKINANAWLTAERLNLAVAASGLTKDKVAAVETAIKALDLADVTVEGITTEQLAKIVAAADLTTAEVVKVITAINAMKSQQVLTTAEIKKAVDASGLTKAEVTAVKTAIDSLSLSGGGLTADQLAKLLAASGLTTDRIKDVISNTAKINANAWIIQDETRTKIKPNIIQSKGFLESTKELTRGIKGTGEDTASGVGLSNSEYLQNWSRFGETWLKVIKESIDNLNKTLANKEFDTRTTPIVISSPSPTPRPSFTASERQNIENAMASMMYLKDAGEDIMLTGGIHALQDLWSRGRSFGATNSQLATIVLRELNRELARSDHSSEVLKDYKGLLSWIRLAWEFPDKVIAWTGHAKQARNQITKDSQGKWRPVTTLNSIRIDDSWRSPYRHTGGMISETGTYELMKGERVLSTEQTKRYDNPMRYDTGDVDINFNIDIQVNGQTSSEDIGTSIADTIVQVLSEDGKARRAVKNIIHRDRAWQ